MINYITSLPKYNVGKKDGSYTWCKISSDSLKHKNSILFSYHAGIVRHHYSFNVLKLNIAILYSYSCYI